MKKNLIALAVFGAFSGAALAQSNVTLYGIVDVNYQYNDPSSSAVSSTAASTPVTSRASRWGVRGSEALSPEPECSVHARRRFQRRYRHARPTHGSMYGDAGNGSLRGAVQSRLFGRQAWGGLSGGWGTVVAGRVATFSSGTGSFDMYGNADPFLTGFGDSALPFFVGSGTALG